MRIIGHRTALWFAAATAVVAGIGCPPPSPCKAPCDTGLTCDPGSAQCVPALLEGSLCPGPDGGVCAPPLDCGAVTSEENRCSVDCTTKNASFVCAPGQSCYARPTGVGGFCVTPAAAGDPCDTSRLVLCLGTSLICVAATAASPAGECFAVCDPAADNCVPGESCADPWAPQSPTLGICAVPSADGTCDYTQFRFCPRRETCARGAGSTRGFCHLRCSPGTVGICPPGEQCLTPWPDTPDEGFCAAPQPTGAACNAGGDLWCGSGDLCVYIAGVGTECAVDCTNNPGACTGTTTTCRALGDGRSACI